jgi:NADPH2:quinone reductase
MRAFAIDRFGEAGGVHELPDPQPAEGQVRVRVEAAGLNPADVYMLSGAYKDFMEHRFPLVPGLDLAGVVDQVADGVSGLRVGDRVFGVHGKMWVGEGSLAELVNATEATLARRPDGLDTEFAAALPLAGVCALVVVEAARLRPDDAVLVLGAAGGVGGFALQLAAAAGAQPVAVTRALNHDYVRSLGAVAAIDYESQDALDLLSAGGTELAAIIDLVGNKAENNRLSVLVRPGGHVVSMVGAADQEALGARGVLAANVGGQVSREKLEQLGDLVAQGMLRRPEITSFTLEQTAEAYARLGGRHLRGKFVVRT